MLLDSLKMYVRGLSRGFSQDRRRRQAFSGVSSRVETLEVRALLSATVGSIEQAERKLPTSPPESAIRDDDVQRMYRTYNSNADYTIFTTQPGEYDMLNGLKGYQEQSVGRSGFGVMKNATHGAGPIHRLYNPNNGQHYFTMSGGERDWLNSLGWTVEPDMGNAFSNANAPAGSLEIFMLYKHNGGDHMFTVDPAERDRLLKSGQSWEQQTSLGFAFEVDTVGRPNLRKPTPPAPTPIPTPMPRTGGTIPVEGFHGLTIGNSSNGDSLNFYNGDKLTARGTLKLDQNAAANSPQSATLSVLGVDIALSLSASQVSTIQQKGLNNSSVRVRGIMSAGADQVALAATSANSVVGSRLTMSGSVYGPSDQFGPFIDTMEARFVTAGSPLYKALVKAFYLTPTGTALPGGDGTGLLPGDDIPVQKFPRPVPLPVLPSDRIYLDDPISLNDTVSSPNSPNLSNAIKSILLSQPQVQPLMTSTSTSQPSGGAVRGFTSSDVSNTWNSLTSGVAQAGSTLGNVGQDMWNQFTDAWGNPSQMFDQFMNGKIIYDGVTGTYKFLTDPTSWSNVGGFINTVVGLPGYIGDIPGDAVWQKAFNDMLGISLDLGSGNYWGAVDKSIPNIVNAGDLYSQYAWPNAIDTLSGWGVWGLDQLGINPYDPTSFGSDTDWQQAFQQLNGIADGFFTGGFTGAAQQGLQPIFDFGQMIGDEYFGNQINGLSDWFVNGLDSWGLNQYTPSYNINPNGSSGSYSGGASIYFDDNAPKGANLYGNSYGLGGGTGTSPSGSGSYGDPFASLFGSNYGSGGGYSTDPFGEGFFDDGGLYDMLLGGGYGSSGSNGSSGGGGGYGDGSSWWNDPYSTAITDPFGSVFTPGFFDNLGFEQYNYDPSLIPHYELHGFDDPSSWANSWEPLYQDSWGGYDSGSYSDYGSSYDSSGGYQPDYSGLLSSYQDAINAYNQRYND